MIEILEDKPIRNVDEDLFGRKSLADMISNAIKSRITVNHGCYTIGVYGKWGEGKTSLLNMIESQLLVSNSDHLSIVKFNPWLFKGQESLLIDFFSILAKEPLGQKLLNKIKKYGLLVALGAKTIFDITALGQGISIASGISEIIKALPDGINITKQKEDISNALRESKKHILIIIDDIDRLDKEETHALFRLIKQNANFDNVTYLLAMDIEVVARSIGERYGEGKSKDGYNFIDKIIQVPIVLPQIQPLHIRQVLTTKLHKIFTHLNSIKRRPLDECDQEKIIDYIAPLFTSGRDIIRYVNQIQFTLDTLYDEVDLIDLCLLEALKLFNFEGYVKILNNKSLLLNIELELEKDNENEKKKNELINDILSGTPERILSPMKHIVNFRLLFPSLHSNTIVSEKDRRRLCTKAYFDRYFIGCSPNNMISDSLLYEKFNLLENDTTRSELISFFDLILNKYGWDEFVRVADFMIENSSQEERERSIKTKRVLIALSHCRVVVPKNEKYEYRYNDKKGAYICTRMRNYMYLHTFEKSGKDEYDIDTAAETAKCICEESPLHNAIHFVKYLDINSIPREIHDQILVKLLNRLFCEKGEDEIFTLSSHKQRIFFNAWKNIENEKFLAFIKQKIVEPTFDIKAFIEKHIEKVEDGGDYLSFIRLFECKQDIYKAIMSKVSSKERDSSPAIKMFLRNCSASENNKVPTL